jgi:DNA polymerase-1
VNDRPAAPPQVIKDRAGVARLGERLAAAPPRALALALLLEDADDLPRDLRRDHRRARPAALGVAIKDAPPIALVGAALEDLAPLAAALGPAAAAPPYVVIHGAHAVLGVLGRRGLEVARFGCTVAAATLLAEGADGLRDDRELAPLVKEHLGYDLPEGLRRGLLPPTLMSTAPTLAAAHAGALLPLMRALTPKLRELRLAKTFELECALVPAVLAMENVGVPLDARALQRLVDDWRKERRTAEEPSRIARLDKLISTLGYWPRDYVDLDGRIRCRLLPLTTDSGRFSCQSPNLQQVPAEHTAPGVRACFAAPPGRALVIADYAQIELRVAAHIAGCTTLRQVFVDGRDVHRATAAGLARKPEAEVTDHERKLAKAINFGFLFGMGARRFREYAQASYGLELDLAGAERARDAFFRTFPGIAAWHRRVGQLSAKARSEDVVVHTILGRRKRFAAGKFSFNSALNIPVQGTAAEGFKLAMIELHRELMPLGGAGILVVHDEYIAEVPEENADAARALVQRTMEAAMAKVVPSVPIVAEAHVARSWAEK